MTDSPVIAIEGLVKDYQGLRPLRLRYLVLEPADRVAISGLDATAAEVLVNIVNGAILPDSGEVRVFGRRTETIASEAEWFSTLDRFGIVTARAVLLEGLTVQQNLALPLSIELDELPPEIVERTVRLAEEVGMDAAMLPRPMSETGAGLRMRMHLARAIATDPQVLLLEHPTSAIPREDVAAFASSVHLVAVRRRLTMLAITEDVEFAGVVAERHYRLQGGTGELTSPAGGWRRWLGKS